VPFTELDVDGRTDDLDDAADLFLFARFRCHVSSPVRKR
jgi:hypothetical protein